MFIEGNGECHIIFLSSFVLLVQNEENSVSDTAVNSAWKESNFQPYPSVVNLSKWCKATA